MNLLLPTLRADLTSVETYSFDHGLPLKCPIIALGGDRDKAVTRDQLDAWRVHTASTFTRQLFPGEHFYLREHVETVCQTIQQHLQS
jgi:surfactin synthase thioesterase subunit